MILFPLQSPPIFTQGSYRPCVSSAFHSAWSQTYRRCSSEVCLEVLLLAIPKTSCAGVPMTTSSAASTRGFPESTNQHFVSRRALRLKNISALQHAGRKPSFSVTAEAIPNRALESVRLSRNGSRTYLTIEMENRSCPVSRG